MIKSFVPRLFSWQHLLWLVPCFLAGLLESWLLQKCTERAVGISTLGVHLCNGQNLILWDEIKEVRPTQGSEYSIALVDQGIRRKTIMRWTSLERHSELKAAVEKLCPGKTIQYVNICLCYELRL